MKFVVQFDTDNDQFTGPNRDTAIADTLRTVASRIQLGMALQMNENRFKLLDDNGNNIGTAQLISGGMIIR